MVATRVRRVTFALIAALTLLIAGAHGATATADGPIGHNPAESAFGTQTRPLIEDESTLVYGPDQSILSRTSPGTSASWHLVDHLRSLRFASAGPGPGRAYEYGPFGGGTGARYAGHPYDLHQAIYTTPTRRYASGLGRFLSTDSQRQNASPYIYAGGDPINNVDPDGSMYVPFYLMSGFQKDYLLNDTKASRFAQSVQSAITGNNTLRMVHTADEFFDLTGDYEKGSRFRAIGSKTLRPPGHSRTRAEHHNDILYWLVGDGPEETPYDAGEVIRLWRSWAPGMAERIVILDFSGSNDRSRGIRESLTAAEIDHGLIRVQATTLPLDGPLKNRPYITGFKVGEKPMQRHEFNSYVAGYADELGQRLGTTRHLFGPTNPQSGSGTFGGAGHVPPTNLSGEHRSLLLETNHAVVDMSEEMLIPPIVPPGED